MATKSYFVGPQDGWVNVHAAATGAGAFHDIRISAVPYTHPFYVYGDAALTPSTTGTAASQTVTFAVGVPIANETITVGGEVFTFKATRVNPFEVAIGVDNLTTATNFENAVNTDSTKANATIASNVVTLHAYAPGTSGNGTTLTEAATNVTVGGATFSGGLDADTGVYVCHHPFQAFNSTSAGNVDGIFVRVVNPAQNSQRSDGRVRIDVYLDGGTLA